MRKALSAILCLSILACIYYFGSILINDISSIKGVSDIALPINGTNAENAGNSQTTTDKSHVYTPNSSGSTMLTPEEEMALKILARAKTLPESISMDIKRLSADKIADALLKSGAFYYLNYSSSTLLGNSTLIVTPRYKIAWEISYAEEIQDTNILSAKAGIVYKIVKNIIDKNISADMSEYEMELTIHDYIVLNADYDESAPSTAGNTDSGKLTDIHDSYTPYGLLVNRKGVCQAYSELMLIFMRMLGIETQEVTGVADGGPHSWNRVKIGGDYYNVDVTWNDPKTEGPSILSYAYFNITDEMLAKTHTWERDDDRRSNSFKYNYYNYNNLVVNNQADFEEIVIRLAALGERQFEVRCDGINASSLSYDFIADIPGSSRVLTQLMEKQNVLRMSIE